MKLAREVNSYRKRSFAVNQKGMCKGLFLVACAVLNYTAYAQPAPNRPATTPATPAPDAPVAIARVQQDDRMAILESERKSIKERLAKLAGSGDQAAIARTNGDLDAIEREIARVQREPVRPTKTDKPPAAAPVKTESAAQAANQESQVSAGEKVTYEGWDIFKNFGRKGSQ